MKKLWRETSGNVLLVVGASMPLVIGAAGLGVDTIQWTLWKRQLQRAADSAALAGVYAKIQEQGLNEAIDTDLDKNEHTGIELLAGYPETTEVAHPTNLWTNGVQVKLALQKRLAFSSFFLSSPPTITAQGTAATIRTGVYCVVSLEDTSNTGIKASGNGSLGLGCGLITNSTSLDAAISTGSSSVTATTVAAVGDVMESDNWGGAELLPFTVKQPDPFGDITPDTSTCPSTGGGSIGASTTPLQPGCYSSLRFTGAITLADGTYVIDGGNLEFGANAKVTCNACTFILTNDDMSPTATIGQLKMNGGAEVILTAPTSGTYDGILVYQDRRAPSGSSAVNNINGNANSVLSGAFYFPNQQLQIGGTATLEFACGQFVARTVEFTGNGGLTNECTAPPNVDDFMGLHVKIVA